MNDEATSSGNEAVEGAPPAAPTPTGDNGKKKIMFVVLAVVIVVGGVFGYNFIQFRRTHVSTDDARVKGTMVTISSRVPGYVLKMDISEGDIVKKDQRLVKLDPSELREKLAITRADLDSSVIELRKAKLSYTMQRKQTKASVDQAGASVEVAQSRIKRAQEDLELEIKSRAEEIKRAHASLEASKAAINESLVRVDMAKAEYRRNKELYENGVIPKQVMDEKDEKLNVEEARHISTKEKMQVASANLRLNRTLEALIGVKQEVVKTYRGELKRSLANLDRAEATRTGVEMSREDVKVLESKIEKKRAKLREVEKLLDDTEIFSPLDGVVSKTVADDGERVQPGQPLLIINDINDVWVSANIEETYIRRVRVDQIVDVKVDAFPGRIFKGRVMYVGAAAASEFSLLPNDNSNRNFTKVTQRIPVKIRVEDSRNELKPGMMVIVQIDIRTNFGYDGR